MKAVLIGILMLIASSVGYGKTDSLMCFTKTEAITIVNKIRLLQDSLTFMNVVVANQDSLIDKYNQRILVFNQQLANRNQTIDMYKRQSEIMEQAIKDLQPKWYDNKFLWAGTGVVATLVVIILIK